MNKSFTILIALAILLAGCILPAKDLSNETSNGNDEIQTECWYAGTMTPCSYPQFNLADSSMNITNGTNDELVIISLENNHDVPGLDLIQEFYLYNLTISLKVDNHKLDADKSIESYTCYLGTYEVDDGCIAFEQENLDGDISKWSINEKLIIKENNTEICGEIAENCHIRLVIGYQNGGVSNSLIPSDNAETDNPYRIIFEIN